MKMFSECSDCDNCYINYVGGCLAGHGDDDFVQITEKDVIKIIKKGWVKYDSDIKKLLKKFPNIERTLKLDKINGKI